MNGHVLIVEDEPALYERLRRALIKAHFTVDIYTKSYDEAITRLSNQTPDVVLLDINLQGAKTGLDLGHILDTHYQIPFIYVTDMDDPITFSKGLHSNHEQFIVKTKPRLNIDDVLRAIHTLMHKKNTQRLEITKDGIMGLKDYLDNVRHTAKGEITRIPIPFKDIAYFTVKPFPNTANNTSETLLSNYVWFLTTSNQRYFFKSSLKKLESVLPRHFIRINESYIINLSAHTLDGRINGSRISIMGEELSIKRTYSKALENRINLLYHT